MISMADKVYASDSMCTGLCSVTKLFYICFHCLCSLLHGKLERVLCLSGKAGGVGCLCQAQSLLCVLNQLFLLAMLCGIKHAKLDWCCCLTVVAE